MRKNESYLNTEDLSPISLDGDASFPDPCIQSTNKTCVRRSISTNSHIFVSKSNCSSDGEEDERSFSECEDVHRSDPISDLLRKPRPVSYPYSLNSLPDKF